MNDFIDQMQTLFSGLVRHLPISLGFIIVLFAIQIVNVFLHYRLNLLGIWPRKTFGFIGIPFSPFLHGNFSHLMFNMLPLFIFSNLILLQGASTFFAASMIIILISGLLTWLFARPGIHIGASALIMGYLGFIVIDIYHHPTYLSVIVGVACLYYFGGLLTGLAPQADKRISWEGHLFGFIAGIITAFLI